MDISFQNNSRNGVEGEYFNFLPLIPVAFGVKAVVNKGKAKKYKSKEVQTLQAEYPWAETTAEQDRLILKLRAVQDAKEREVNVAKNKTQKKFRQAELDAINLYLKDANAYRKELSDAEKQDAMAQKGTGIIGNNTMEAPQIEVVKLTPANAVEEAAAGAANKGSGNKMLLYVGIGAAALLLIFLLTKKKQ